MGIRDQRSDPPMKHRNRPSRLLVACECAFVANETGRSRPERGGKATVVHRDGNVDVSFGVLQKINFHLVFRRLEFHFVTLVFVRQFRYDLRGGHARPFSYFCLQYRLPFVPASFDFVAVQAPRVLHDECLPMSLRTEAVRWRECFSSQPPVMSRTPCAIPSAERVLGSS